MLRIVILLLLAKVAFQSDVDEDYDELIHISGHNLTLMGDYDILPIVRQVAEDPCWRAPCAFGQTCALSKSGAYLCKTLDNDNSRKPGGHPCIPNPCPPNTQCFANLNWQATGDYSCVSSSFCTPTSNTCQNGGTCVNGELCVCDSRYKGTYCEQQLPPIVDPCNPTPCFNGNCRPSGQSYYCDCNSGYTGIICDRPILPKSPCTLNPCQNNGYCSNSESSYICTCLNDYTGRNCEIPPQPVTARCIPNPCSNGGTCYDYLTRETCSCMPGFKGTTCDEVDRCTPNPCRNSGSCSDIGYDYQCTCPSGYTGSKNCDQINRCVPNPCRNGGTCSDQGYDYQCTCPSGYTGSRNCDQVNRCVPNPCRNGGTCSDQGYDYQCTCPSGYTGSKNCDQINRCVPNPCRNGGTCSDQGYDYQCTCPSGYTGSRNCDQVNRCVSNPCRNGGTCSDQGYDYQCTCPSGYTGSKNCDQLNRCVPNPCLNGGICSSYGSYHTCLCVGGYSSDDCSVPTKALCVPNPCASNEICYDYITYYTCIQKNRQQPCEKKPCKNEGTCQNDDVSGYTCNCANGFTGKDCTITVPPVGACKVNMCKNGCKCQESCRHSSGYYCKSELGYIGKNCDVAPPTVVCGNNAISVKVNAAFVREYTTDLSKFKITVFPNTSPAPAQCVATLTGGEYVISIPSPFTSCMTSVVQAGDGSTTVANNIFMSLTSTNGFDMPVPIVNFKCVYEKQFTITSSFQPNIEPIYPTVTSSGKSPVSASMKLCKVASCPAECDQIYGVTEGATYTVGEMIHLSISTDQTTQNLAVHEMFLSCSKSPSTSVKSADVVLVSGGCAATTLTNYVPTTVPHNAVGPKVCSSFQVPKLTCPLVYIHAKLRQCQGAQVGTCSTGTGKYCIGSNRRKRSVEYQQVMGPIFIIIRNRETKAVVFPDRSLVNSTGVLNDLGDLIRILPNESNPMEGKPYISYIVYIAVTALVFIFTLLLLSFVIRKLCALTNNQRDRF